MLPPGHGHDKGERPRGKFGSRDRVVSLNPVTLLTKSMALSIPTICAGEKNRTFQGDHLRVDPVPGAYAMTMIHRHLLRLEDCKGLPQGAKSGSTQSQQLFPPSFSTPFCAIQRRRAAEGCGQEGKCAYCIEPRESRAPSTAAIAAGKRYNIGPLKILVALSSGNPASRRCIVLLPA